MTNIEAIKEFIKECPLLDADGKINVDYLEEDIGSYSIDQTPSSLVYKTYTDGTEMKQITFDFSIRNPFNDYENIQNSAFCEDFVRWIKEQDSNRNLPKINGAQAIECTSPGTVLKVTDTTSLYVIQMRVLYLERI